MLADYLLLEWTILIHAAYWKLIVDDTLSTSAGCDSIVTLNLVINNSYSSVESITSCSNYLWNGTTYSQSGTYYDSLQTASGCDSVETLNLIINNSSNNTLNISACDYLLLER